MTQESKISVYIIFMSHLQGYGIKHIDLKTEQDPANISLEHWNAFAKTII